ncbi:MAG TPA: universal stress protein [Nevskia sp.]|nr:universal stress protein [Nevskia sp.]
MREAARSRPIRQSRIAIAWNGSPEAIRAVHAALCLLQLAEQIFVLASAPAASQSPVVCEPEFSIEAFLARHGLSAQHVMIDASHHRPEEAILVAAANVGADLLVMGASGTARPEPLGTTSFILEQAMLPLLLHN